MLDLIGLAIAPAFFVLLYFYLMDRYEPEPLGWVARVFLIGAVMVVPAILIELIFPPGLFLAVVVAPVVEESLKFAAVYFTVYRDEEFSEPVDGIVYAAAAALGFATVENIFYVLEGGLVTGLLRAVASVPGHALFSVIWGYALGIARFSPENRRPFLIAAGLAGAMLFHGIFNLLASDTEYLGMIVLLVVLVPLGWLVAHRSIRSARSHPDSEESRASRAAASGQTDSAGAPAQEGPVPVPGNILKTESAFPDHFCTSCGSRVDAASKYCRKCGARLDRS